MFLLCRCGGLRGCRDELHGFHPLLPVSGTGTGFGPLPSRERGYDWLVLSCCCPAHPALWFPAYAGMTVWWDCLAAAPLDCGSSPQ